MEGLNAGMELKGLAYDSLTQGQKNWLIQKTVQMVQSSFAEFGVVPTNDMVVGTITAMDEEETWVERKKLYRDVLACLQ